MTSPKAKRKKTGGREAGTPNRRSLRVLDDLRSAGINLVRVYIDTVMKIEDPKERLAALRVLFRFCYPRLKEIDPTRLIESEALPAAPPGAPPFSPQPLPAVQPQQVLATMLALAATNATGSAKSDDAGTGS